MKLHHKGGIVKKWPVILSTLSALVLLLSFQNFSIPDLTRSSNTVVISSQDLKQNYGFKADGVTNDGDSLKKLFADLNKNQYTKDGVQKSLENSTVVLDFSNLGTICAFYPLSNDTRRVSTKFCQYQEDPESLSPQTYKLQRGHVTVKLGSATKIDATLIFAGSLTKEYVGIYYPTQWLPVGSDFSDLKINNVNKEASDEVIRDSVVAVELSASSYGDMLLNQSGIHFSKVTSFTSKNASSQITLEDGLRFAFRRPQFSLVDAVKLKTGDRTLSTNKKILRIKNTPENLKFFSSLQPKSMLRFENLTGTDSVFNQFSDYFDKGSDNFLTKKQSYFEYNQVAALKNEGSYLSISLDSPLAYDYGEFWLINAPFTNDIQISGASQNSSYIAKLIVQYASDVSITNLNVNSMSLASVYDFKTDQVKGVAQGETIVFGHTYCRKGVISNYTASGARSYRDNANIKFMSPLDLNISNVHSFDSERIHVAGSKSPEGNYTFYIDFLYTPYVSWGQNVTVNGMTLAKPNDPDRDRAAWIVGLRNSAIWNVNTTGLLVHSFSAQNTFGNLQAEKGLFFEYTDNQILNNYKAAHLRLLETNNMTLRKGFLVDASQNYGRCLWVQNSAHVRIEQLLFYAGTQYCNGISTYLQSSEDVYLSRASDLGRQRAVAARSPGVVNSPSLFFHSSKTDTFYDTRSCLGFRDRYGISTPNSYLAFGSNVCP